MDSMKNAFLASLPLRPRQPDDANSHPADKDERVNGDSSSVQTDQDEFFPSIWDVLRVRHILQWKVIESFPTELVDEIIDEAEYWPSNLYHTATSPDDKRNQRNRTIIRQDRDKVLLKTVPLCYDEKELSKSSSPKPLPHRSTHPCRKIIFHLSSHDQGGGNSKGPNMYQGESWTWFDTEVIHAAHTKKMFVNGEEQELLPNEKGLAAHQIGPDVAPLLPGPKKLQINGARVREVQDVEIVWHYLDNISPDSEEAQEIERTKGRGRATLDGSGVRDLEIGDSVAVWARARFPGWTNNVYNANARVFWAI